MRSILFERTLKLDNDGKLPKYGRNRGDIDTKLYDFYNDEADVEHLDSSSDEEDRRELQALVDSGEFADENPNMDTDNEWESKKTGYYHPKVEYDKRKKNYGLATAYKGSKNTDAFSDAATRAADDKYEDDLRWSSSAKSYAAKSRYPKGAKMHALRNPGGVRPELVDYDPDSDPNVKWYD